VEKVQRRKNYSEKKAEKQKLQEIKKEELGDLL